MSSTATLATTTRVTAPPAIGLEGDPSLVFQPAVDLATGRLLGFEALLRWHDPAGQLILPGDLIPWAEQHGHMTALNAWVLHEACAQAARWPSNLQVAVNCSLFQLRRGEAADAAADALASSELNPDLLTVEVSDGVVDDQGAAADLEAMARLGVQLTLDDVTSGQLALEPLHRHVVNTMKIDGSVVAALATPGGSGRQAVETIVALCRSIGICTVAEAVESAAQVEVLRDLRVDVGQGYYFSPPLSADDAMWLASMNPLPVFAMALPDATAPDATLPDATVPDATAEVPS